MHNRSYNEQDAIQRLLLFEEGLSRLIEPVSYTHLTLPTILRV